MIMRPALRPKGLIVLASDAPIFRMPLFPKPDGVHVVLILDESCYPGLQRNLSAQTVKIQRK